MSFLENNEVPQSIHENPDSVSRTNDTYHDADARAFGYLRGKFFLDKKPRTHWMWMMVNEPELYQKSIDKKIMTRDMLRFAGRYWSNSKVMSLWRYPKTFSEWKKLIADVSRAANIPKKELKVELVQGQKLPKKHEEGWDSHGAVVPALQFITAVEKYRLGIKQRSSSEIAKAHGMSPIAKGGKKVPMGMGSKKRPAGMSHSQYRQKFSTSESVNESPDFIRTINAKPSDDDAYPFGYYNGKFIPALPGEESSYDHYPFDMDKIYTHAQLGYTKTNGKSMNFRRTMKYAGRIWLDNETFSLWSYPTTVNTWKKLVNDIVNAYRRYGINKVTLKVELVNNKVAKDVKKYGNWWEGKTVLVSSVIDGLEKKMIKISQRGEAELGKQHMVSPLVKKQRNVPKGVGSKKRPAGLSHSQYWQKRSASESTLKLVDVLKEIGR